MVADRQLLFAVLAAQLTEVTPEDLLGLGGAWAQDPSRSLGERLVEAGKLNAEDLMFVEQAVERAVGAHGGDASATLADLGRAARAGESLRPKGRSDISLHSIGGPSATVVMESDVR